MTADITELTDLDKWLLNKNHKMLTNRRKSTRYVRRDIGATIKKIGLLRFVNIKSDYGIPVRLVDISSRGVSVETDKKLPLNRPILLTLRFSDFKEFTIPSIVVRKSEQPKQCYGIKYEQVNEELADHLLATQKNLKFK